MPIHPLVTGLRFARSELVRCLEEVSAEDAQRRPLPMNCLSWMVGHMASHEQVCWVIAAQGRTLVPGLEDLVGYGKPASTPPLEDMWAAWRTITQAADEYLNTLTAEVLQQHLQWQGETVPENIGTMLLRNTYHYWFHIGEAHAVRQMLGHVNLPDFVGDLSAVRF